MRSCAPIVTLLSVYDELLALARLDDFGLFDLVGGKRINLYFDGSARLFAKSFGYGNFLLSLSEDDAFGKAILDHAERKKTLQADRSKLEDIVNGTLSAFNTFDDLLTGWPEAESFITAR